MQIFSLILRESLYNISQKNANCLVFSVSKIEPAFHKHNTVILCAISSYYAEIVPVAIQSLTNHMNTYCTTSNYDILLIANRLTDLQIHRITSIAKNKRKLAIRFLNTIPFRENHNQWLNRDYYLKADVMLMNLAQMRTKHTDILFKALSTRTDFIWLDQDMLNIAV